MAQAIVTFDIIEYLPLDFKFDNFSFIISSEAKDFEQEISYLNKNQITHKATLNKRELKYSIKTTKNSSLIGISDLTIPSSVLSKRENIYDKTCTINMSDSIKRVIFGNTSPSNSLKINFHITLQYKEKEKTKIMEKKEKDKEHKHNFSTSGKKIKSYERSESFGKGGEPKRETGSAANTFSQRNFAANKKNNIRKQRSSSKPASNMKGSQTMKPKTQIFNNNNKLKEVQKAILDDELNDEEKKNKNKSKNKDSFIDEELNKEIKEINPQFINFMKDFNNKNPLDKLNSINDINEMMEYTKNIVDQLLDYQLKYYDMYNKVFLTKKKLKKILLQNNEKLRVVKKQINKLDEENDLYEIKEILNDRNNNNNIKDLLPLKEDELDTFKELYGAYIDKSLDNTKENKEEIEKKKNLDEKKKNEEKAENLLIKVLTHSVNKYGPLNKLFTQTNSTEPERLNIRKLATKYNLPINVENEESQNKENKNESNENKKEEEKENDNNNVETNEEKKEEKENKEEKVSDNNNNEDGKQNIFDGKITKWEYVSTEKPDKIDKKLEQYLKYFYSKRTFPKVLFKKTSTNNYEYGTQKVMVKIEGDTIRIRFVGGYLLIDKFIELNAATEEKKVKKQNEKNTSTGGIKKKDSTSNKKK